MSLDSEINEERLKGLVSQKKAIRLRVIEGHEDEDINQQLGNNPLPIVGRYYFPVPEGLPVVKQPGEKYCYIVFSDGSSSPAS
jgi:hypothetical protein